MPVVEPQPFDAAVRASILRDAPSFAGLADASLAAVAAAMVVCHYPYKAVLSRLGEAAGGRPLRIVLLGSCLVQTPGLSDARRSIGPGMILGEEGLVAWASDLGLVAPVPGGQDDYYAYAAEDCWTLELPADRFAALFGAGAHASVLAAARGAAWRRARAPDLLALLRASAELGHAAIDDLHGILEGGVLREAAGEIVDADASVLVVLEGSVTLTQGGDEASAIERGPGAVIGQTQWLRGDAPDHDARRIGDVDDDALVLEIPTRHYMRQLHASPELTTAVARSLPELAHPRYRTEVSLILATSPLQVELPLRAITAALAQTIRANLFDRTAVVRLVWASVDAELQPLVIAVPQGSPETIYAAVHAGLLAILAASADELDVLLVDPSALSPGPELQRTLAWAVVDLPAPTRVSYLFARRAEWAGILLILGDRALRTHVLPTVVLGAERPAPGLGAALDEIAGSFTPRREGSLGRGLAALPAFARGQLRRLADEGPTALLELAGLDAAQRQTTAGPPRVWPIRSVRLRLAPAGLEALARDPAQPPIVAGDDLESLRRWARAITGRRVGVALGGAGALSYVGVPFLRDLLASGVPIDVVSGTSFGSIVGTYYATLGEAGLDLIVRHWYWAQITVAWGWLSTRPLQQWINFDLGFVDLANLEIPMIPVATNAYNGREWDLRAGLAGHTCAASGSLPPLAPTYDQGTRLIDGALSAGTPDRVLVEAGAAMVVGVNSVPAPWPEPPPPTLPFPLLNDLVRTLNPITRLTDSIRGYGMLFRQAAQSQEYAADVTYAADPLFGNGATFFLRHAIVYQAEHSQALREAVALARERWTELLTRPRRPSSRPTPPPG